jgi:hypothetical protein
MSIRLTQLQQSLRPNLERDVQRVRQWV